VNKLIKTAVNWLANLYTFLYMVYNPYEVVDIIQAEKRKRKERIVFYNDGTAKDIEVRLDQIEAAWKKKYMYSIYH
jgi:hypothetical protein